MLDQDDLDKIEEAESNPNKFVVRGPSEQQKLGPTTVVCLILNRTIGSGIFVLPATVLQGTGSIGIALCFWVIGGLVTTAALMVWLELSMSVPRFEISPGQEVAVPRSGGEKNFLEYIYGPKIPTKRSNFFVTCVYGVLFIVLGNLSGNAITFGVYVLEAAYGTSEGYDAAARGLAVVALTVACLLHAFWRKGGIWLNNAFAILKVAILLLIIVAGLVALGGVNLGNGPIHTGNFNTQTSFSRPRTDAASYAGSLVYSLYPYSGFLQPFYVLSEVRKPHGTFAKATIGTLGSVTVLYVLVNIAFFSVVSSTEILTTGLDIGPRFFQLVFGTDKAQRAMAAIIAFSIFGNIIVMTFTASRVKQEIAKEGVLPFSRFFARSTTTLFAYLGDRFSSTPKSAAEREDLEQSPIAALFLHWTFSVLLIAVTAGPSARVAYAILVSLYTYVIVLIVGFFVSTGLLYLKLKDRKAWHEISANFHPWGGPAAALLVSVVTGFLLITSFLPPSDDSKFSFANQGYEWWIPPTVGLGGLVAGVGYWMVFRFVVPKIKGKDLEVDRVPIIISDDHGGWVQVHEIVQFSWGVGGFEDDEK